jgi:hypothetical protein
MLTGQNFYVNGTFREEFKNMGQYFELCEEVQSLDAPDIISAGGHERVKAMTIKDYSFCLPMVVRR